jgi:hypothetical protein
VPITAAPYSVPPLGRHDAQSSVAPMVASAARLKRGKAWPEQGPWHGRESGRGVSDVPQNGQTVDSASTCRLQEEQGTSERMGTS